jgi:C4-dicarboxylate transporter, DctM subunit
MAELLILLLVLLFFSGAPLFAILIAATALGSIYAPAEPRSFSAEFGGTFVTLYRNADKDEAKIFATIPLFIYAGYIMASARTSDRLVRFANALLGWMPGGLAIVTIFACAIFTIFTGASGVTIVALGALIMPALVKQKYPQRFSLGLITGTGSVGLLFPPALPLIVYGTVYGLQANELRKAQPDPDGAWTGTFQDVGDADRMMDAVTFWESERFLFAGIIPGLVLIGCLALVAVAVAIMYKIPRQKFEPGELARSFVVVLPELVLPLVVLVPLVMGWANIPQLAAITVLYLIALEIFVYRDIKPRTLWTISAESLALIGTIFLVVYVSGMFTNMLVTAKIPQELVGWAKDNVESKLLFLLALNVLLIVVGMLMDIFSAVLIVVPLVAPIAFYYGIDPYHLGVIFLLNLEIGYLTPPVGLNLFIASFKFQKPVPEVVRSSLPFLGAMIVALVLVTYVPALTWLPPQRTGNLTALHQLVIEGTERATAIEEISLPGDIVVKRDDCATLPTVDRQKRCTDMFVDVSQCRRTHGETAEACRKLVNAYWAAEVGIADVTLPNGTAMKKADCATLEDSIDRDACDTFFEDIAACRARADTEGATLAKECETDRIAEYMDDMGLDDDDDGDD